MHISTMIRRRLIVQSGCTADSCGVAFRISAGAWFSEPAKRGLRPEAGPAPAGEACFRAGAWFLVRSAVDK